MPKQCQDAYFVQFNLFPEMLSYHEDLRRRSRWVHTSVKSLEVAPLDKTAPLFSDHTGFDAEVTEDAIADTADHLGLAVKVDGRWFPLRDTSYPSLLDRAKINGTALPKLSREKLSGVLNTCLPLHKSEALMLIRDEKVSAAHSGDTRDYSVLEIDQLLDSLQAMLFAQFDDSIARLSGLLKVHLDHPVNAMTAVCKRLSLPKKAALEAIDMFEAAMGEDPATAHDVFMAMQEIPFILKTGGKTPEAKLLALQESMARALTLRWTDYDFAKKVSW